MLNGAQENLVAVYSDILKALSDNINHNEDINRYLSRAPDITDNLLAYERFGFYSPLIKSTNAKQIAKRIPSSVLTDIVLSSMLKSILSFEVASLGKEEYWKDVVVLATRYTIVTQYFSPNIQTSECTLKSLCYASMLLENKSEYSKVLLKLIGRYNVIGTFNAIEYIKSLHNTEHSDFRLLSMGLKCFSNEALEEQFVELENGRRFCLTNFLALPMTKVDSAFIGGFWAMHSYKKFTEFLPKESDKLHYY